MTNGTSGEPSIEVERSMAVLPRLLDALNSIEARATASSRTSRR